MATGILGIVLSCFGPLPGIAAIVLGGVALAQIKKSPQTTGGKPFAITGIVTGALTVLFYGLLLIWMILMGRLN